MTIDDREGSAASESREYCFVIMSYRKEYDAMYEQLKRLIESRTHLRCERADRRPEPGRDLLGKVHEMILAASVVVADVTEHSPNVYYEYGYATAHDRRPILFLREGAEPPTDLVGKETLRYRGTPADDGAFAEKFLACVNQQLRSPLPEQRRMLSSPRPFPAHVFAAPRVLGPDSKHWWHPDERHTFGDNLGITGIMTAYGNLFGTRELPELLNAQCVPRDIFVHRANCFCIGSAKLNRATAYFLGKVQKGLSPRWRMAKIGDGADKRVVFKAGLAIDRDLRVPVKEKTDKSISDYGLIIRAPHPQDSQRIVLIAAGRHSIGTHAACSAVIHQKSIQTMEERLKALGIRLGNTQQPFWAIVRGKLLANGLVSEGVEIVEVGGYRADDSMSHEVWNR